MDKLIFKGDMNPPFYEHGQAVRYLGNDGVVQHRKYSKDSNSWSYGVVFDSPLGIQWMNETHVALCAVVNN